MKVYQYLPDLKIVREKSRMAEPQRIDFELSGDYARACNKYQQYLAELKSYPASGFGKEHEGKDLVEGVDLQFGHWCNNSVHGGNGKNYFISVTTVEKFPEQKKCECCHLIAVPLEAEAEKQMPKYWKDVVKERIRYFRAKYHVYEAEELQAALDSIDRLVPPLSF